MKLLNKLSMPKLINGGIFLSFFVCYLEWGIDHSAFLFQMEFLIFTKKTDTFNTFTHPIILLPFFGQMLLFFTLFQKKPDRKLTFISMALLSFLVLLILTVGILSLNFKIILSTLPFILISIFAITRRNEYYAPKK